MREKIQAFLLWCVATVFIFIAAFLDEKMKIININAQSEAIFIYWVLIASTGGFLTAFFIKVGIIKVGISEHHHKKTKPDNFSNPDNVVDIRHRPQ